MAINQHFNLKESRRHNMVFRQHRLLCYTESFCKRDCTALKNLFQDILIHTVQTWKNHCSVDSEAAHTLSIFVWLLPGRGYICVVFIAEVCQCCCVIWWKSFCALAVLVLLNSPVCQSYDFKPTLHTIVISKTKGSCHSREMQSHSNSVTEAQLHPQPDLSFQQLVSFKGRYVLS